LSITIGFFETAKKPSFQRFYWYFVLLLIQNYEYFLFKDEVSEGSKVLIYKVWCSIVWNNSLVFLQEYFVFDHLSYCLSAPNKVYDCFKVFKFLYAFYFFDPEGHFGVGKDNVDLGLDIRVVELFLLFWLLIPPQLHHTLFNYFPPIHNPYLLIIFLFNPTNISINTQFMYNSFAKAIQIILPCKLSLLLFEFSIFNISFQLFKSVLS